MDKNTRRIQEEYKKNTRRIQYDLLRTVACLMVLMLHVSAFYWTKLSPACAEWKILNLYDSFVRSSVPLFFMLSGVFFLSKEVEAKKLYTKNIFRLFCVLLVWSVLYAADTVGIPAFFRQDAGAMFTAVVNGKYHLWFLWSMIGVYLFVPLLSALVRYRDGKYLPYFLILFFIFGVGKATLSVYPYPNHSVFDLLNKMPDFRLYLGYFVLGYYLDQKVKRKLPGSLLLVLFAVTASLSAFIGQVDAVQKGSPAGLLYGYFCLPVFAEAVFLFLFFRDLGPCLEGKEKLQRQICFLSANTMGIYLLHPFVLERLDRWQINSLTWSPWISVLLVTLTAFVICLGISALIQKIPLLRKIL